MSTQPARRSRFLQLHQVVYEASRGVIGHRLIGVPTLLLTTTGRRTGTRRTVALVYARDDDGALIGPPTASPWAHDRNVGGSSGGSQLQWPPASWL